MSLKDISSEENFTNFSNYEMLLQSSSDSYSSSESSLFNSSNVNFSSTDYPAELKDVNMTNLISYSILFPFAAIGNLLVFVQLFKNRHRKSRVNLMLLHLTIADMIVAFIFLPTEIIWHLNIEWIFGNVGCKIYKYLSAFGFYSSSLVLVCISLDRYFAVVHPLKVNDAQRRGKIMLSFAWWISAVISIPQSVIFNVQSHPSFEQFYQCVSFGFFDKNEEMIYTLFVISFLYIIPLTIIIVAYSSIILEITRKSKESECELSKRGGRSVEGRQPLKLRRSNVSTIERARSRTLGMTFIIVVAFVWCWTPYSICTLWNFIDQDTFRSMNVHVQDILFILAVSNSVVNPIIYGSRYTLTCFIKRKTLQKSRATSDFPPVSVRYLCCCNFFLSITQHDSRRDTKHCNGSLVTKASESINNRSLLRGINRATTLQQDKRRSTLLAGPHLEQNGVPAELISLVPLNLREKSVPEESEIDSPGITPQKACCRAFALSVENDDISSGYSSTGNHAAAQGRVHGCGVCHSFQDLHDRETMQAIKDSHHSY